VAPTEARASLLHFIMTLAVALIVGLAWLSILSYDSADPPGASIFRPEHQLTNLCGQFGAKTAYYAFYFLGIGTYAVLALCTLVVVALGRRYPLRDAWLRYLGLALLTAAVSTAGALLIPLSPHYPMTGPGGVLGSATLELLLPKLGQAGTAMVVLVTAAIGLLTAADEVVWLLGRMAQRVLEVVQPMVSHFFGALGVSLANVFDAVRAHPVEVAVETPARKSGKREQLSLPLEAEEKPKRKRKTAAAEALEAADELEPVADDAAEEAVDEEEYEYVYEDEDGNPVDPEENGEYEYEEVDASDADSAGEADEDEEYEYEYEDEEDDDDIVADAPAAIEADRLGTNGSGPKLDLNALFGKRPDPEVAYHRPPDDSGYEVPGPTLLDEPVVVDKQDIERVCREKAAVLEQTLNEFGRDVQVVAIETGPVITVFELKLAPGIKVSQIASLTNDMARAMRAPSVRVVAPLPNKNTIGIEVPNTDKEKVRLKDIISALGSRVTKFQIPLFLGKDAAGQPLVADMTKMPHLLIAGTTGSGKSVCVSSIVMSILLTRTPSEVQMVLVDPKVVELTMFKDVPHLMCPIVTDMGKAESILEWASSKMDERYALLAEAGVKDIKGYNKLGEEGLHERFNPMDEEEWKRIPKQLPYLVIIIDELADMMMTSPKEVEFHLCRIAQKSRAVGIHLIVSTQRPSANVVTGLIKSNLPSRIAFRVASRLDSRIVLDQNGGEVLMGQGDMLFLPPGQSKLVRAQGTFIDDDELRRIVKHCAGQCHQSFHPELMRAPKVSGEAGERDELFDEAVSIIVQSGRGSVSLLQRKLTIGYGRASRLVEQMYEAGLVGEYKGSQAREVLVSKDEWENLRNQRDREEAAETAEVD
jgi:S-DNA-T family DNA segregation ATPase FtsK/SpoIIIE